MAVHSLSERILFSIMNKKGKNLVKIIAFVKKGGVLITVQTALATPRCIVAIYKGYLDVADLPAINGKRRTIITA